MLDIKIYLLFYLFAHLTASDRTQVPRRTFTATDMTMRSLLLPPDFTIMGLKVHADSDVVTVIGRTSIFTYDFRSPQQTPVVKDLLWQKCLDSKPLEKCRYQVTLVHKPDQDGRMLLCGTDNKTMLCCHMTETNVSAVCVPTPDLTPLSQRIENLVIKEGEHSVVDYTTPKTTLFVTYSGSLDYVGVHKFGSHKAGPASHHGGLEQHYKGLVLVKTGDPLQDKAYAFYTQKVKSEDPYATMWVPYVSRLCMSDMGGPKNVLQFSWTSQLNARLFCGDTQRRQVFSELVDVAVLYGERRQDHRIYGLFRNEWSGSAVCVYSVEDMDAVFARSAFKGDVSDPPVRRSRECVADSRRTHQTVLMHIMQNLELKEWLRPVAGPGLLLASNHNYTRLAVDAVPLQTGGVQAVLLLFLHDGGVHKVINHGGRAFVIAEFDPFSVPGPRRAFLHPVVDRRLYVDSGRELVQLRVDDCRLYGQTCQECVLARDPHCTWEQLQCTRNTNQTSQDLLAGNHQDICSLDHVENEGLVLDSPVQVTSAVLPARSKYFLRCPKTSHHAHYAWLHRDRRLPCGGERHHCLHLIEDMSEEQEGRYRCVSNESGWTRTVATFDLRMQARSGSGSRSTPRIGPLVVLLLLALGFSGDPVQEILDGGFGRLLLGEVTKVFLSNFIRSSDWKP